MLIDHFPPFPIFQVGDKTRGCILILVRFLIFIFYYWSKFSEKMELVVSNSHKNMLHSCFKTRKEAVLTLSSCIFCVLKKQDYILIFVRINYKASLRMCSTAHQTLNYSKGSLINVQGII